VKFNPKEKTMANKVKAKSGLVYLQEKIEQHPVALANDELLEFGQRLSSVEYDVRSHESHADSVKKDLKAKETALAAERSRLAGIVRNKAEHRDVRVVVLKDLDAREYREIRSDTGEVTFKRPLRPDEMQDSLFDGDAPEAP